jgi:NADH-quinone oxidoreductase subunit N
MLSGIVGGSTNGAADAWSASMFYLVAYVLTTLGTFGVMMLMSRDGHEAEDIADLKGLGRRNPALAFVMLILMFSLAGIPPTIGFYAKLAVLKAVIDAGMIWLAVLAVMMSLVGAFYYLRIVKMVYFDEPVDTHALRPVPSAQALLAVNGALVLLLGLVPGPLMSLCADAVKQAFGG